MNRKNNIFCRKAANLPEAPAPAVTSPTPVTTPTPVTSPTPLFVGIEYRKRRRAVSLGENRDRASDRFSHSLGG
ncbi:hypothetical protein [Microcoleus sp. bin38.metabat.b11b12b14.051]|uniref:hypothetical protein n=1 Tax=Microcoleus sp. bin38.metabat.b11b12b14.051 TaxID=2742709 RepID=UPI0025E8D90E|nr:hypothetical protein [Microcoleus sp. bin38.metabat.b11b12b14.051]